MIPSTHIKAHGCNRACCIPSVLRLGWDGDRWIPRAHWTASQAELVSSQVQRETSSQKIRWRTIEENAWPPHWCTHACMCNLICTHTPMCTCTTQTHAQIIKILKIETIMLSNYPTSSYYPQTWNQHAQETPACPCLLQHYSQWPRCRISLGAHWCMNRKRKCRINAHRVLFSYKDERKSVFVVKWTELEDITVTYTPGTDSSVPHAETKKWCFKAITRDWKGCMDARGDKGNGAWDLIITCMHVEMSHWTPLICMTNTCW